MLYVIVFFFGFIMGIVWLLELAKAADCKPDELPELTPPTPERLEWLRQCGEESKAAEERGAAAMAERFGDTMIDILRKNVADSKHRQ